MKINVFKKEKSFFIQENKLRKHAMMLRQCNLNVWQYSIQIQIGF